MQHLRIKNFCEVIYINYQSLKELDINVLHVVFKFIAAITHKKYLPNEFYELSIS